LGNSAKSLNTFGANPAEQTEVKTGAVEATAPDSTPAETEPTKDKTVDTVLEPIKIAVVIQFSLGSSQYATMALRELMKSGGVKTYKPDFSSGR
jgi:tRNA pseudouridine13 synthase